MLLAIVQSTLQKGIAHDFSKVDHVLVSFIKEQKTYPWLQQYFLWTTEKAEEEKEEKEGSLTSRLRFQTFHRAFTISRNGLKLLLHASCLPASVCSSRYFPGPGYLLKNPPSNFKNISTFKFFQIHFVFFNRTISYSKFHLNFFLSLVGIASFRSLFGYKPVYPGIDQIFKNFLHTTSDHTLLSIELDWIACQFNLAQATILLGTIAKL